MIQPLLATWLTPKQILDTTTICDSHNPCLNIKAKYRTCALSYETCYTKVSNTFKQESGQHRRPMPGCTNCTEHTRVLKWHGLNAVSTVLVPSPLIIVCKPKKQQHDKRSSEPYFSNSRAALGSHEALQLPLRASASSIALEGWVVVVLVDGGWHGVVGSQHQHNRTENHHSALCFDVWTMLA